MSFNHHFDYFILFCEKNKAFFDNHLNLPWQV